MKTKKKKTKAPEASKRLRRWGNQFSKKYTPEEIERFADELLEWFAKPENYWLKDFAISKMFSAQRISEFAEASPYFANCYQIAKDMQESKLVRLGLNKAVNSSMPIFALKNVAGWRDVQDMNLTASVKVVVDNIPKVASYSVTL